MQDTASVAAAEELAAAEAERTKAERALASEPRGLLMVLVAAGVCSVATVLLQGLDVPTYARVLLAMGLAIGALNYLEIWFLRKRLNAAVALLRLPARR